MRIDRSCPVPRTSSFVVYGGMVHPALVSWSIRAEAGPDRVDTNGKKRHSLQYNTFGNRGYVLQWARAGACGLITHW